MNSNPGWIDSHCHLDLLRGDLDDWLIKSREMGLRSCVTIGVDHKSNRLVGELSRNYSYVWGTAGIHPHEAKDALPQHFEYIREQCLSNPKIVAVGECGYDFHYNYSPRKAQEEVFRAQLDLALELGFPVVIHTREAERETMKTMEPYLEKGLRGVFHSFSSKTELADFGIERDFYFSFNGVSTFPKAGEVRESLKKIPSFRLLLETDSPYLSPVPVRGKPNFPGNVAVVGQFIAEFLEMDLAELSQVTRANTKRLFSGVSDED